MGDAAHSVYVLGRPPLRALPAEQRSLAVLLARGLDDAAIARAIGSTDDDVAVRVEVLRQLLGVENRVHVATWVAVQDTSVAGTLHLDQYHPSWIDELALPEREALVGAIDMLTDQFLDDLVHLERRPRRGATFDETRMAEFLPRKHRLKYDQEGFARRFLVALIVVGGKLRAPGGEPVSCVAEELALNAVLEVARALFEDEHGREGDFAVIEEEAFQDHDFAYLFDTAADGLEDDPPADLGLTDLRFESWFTTFNNTPPVHPYDEPDAEWRKRAPEPAVDEEDE